MKADWIYLPIEELKHPEVNVRSHPEKQLRELARSVEMFGQIRPAVIDEDNTILAGNGLIQAMKMLGQNSIGVIRREGLTEYQKMKLMLADNRLYQLGLNNNNVIYEFLDELDNNLDIPGFGEDFLRVAKSTRQESDSSDEANDKKGGGGQEGDPEITKLIEDFGKLPDHVIKRLRKAGEKADEPVKNPESVEPYRCPSCKKISWL